MKPLIVFYGAVNTFSGYGSRARDLVKSLIKIKEPEFDVRVISCNWGACPHGALNANIPEEKAILDRILFNGQMPKQPDVFIMNTVPNEMQKIGKYNILITAGMESSICLPEWIEGCNRADLVLVSSEHAKKVFESSTFEQFDNNTKQKIGILKINTKCEVLFEGVDLNIYFKKEQSSFDLSSVKEDWNYLCIGSWLPGDFMQDRKNISGLIKIFLETFKNKSGVPGLILKTHAASPSIIDREEILDRIDAIRKTVKAHTLPNIYLVHGELTDEQINEIYAHPKIKAFVLFTKGEGFGRPLLEFSLHAKPIITTTFGGQIDFLEKDYNIFVGGTLEKIHQSAVVKNIFHPESMWLNVNTSDASFALKEIFDNYKKYLEPAKRQAYKSKTQFSFDKMTEKFKNILDNNLPKFSQPVTIKLPTLKKVEIPSDIEKVK